MLSQIVKIMRIAAIVLLLMIAFIYIGYVVLFYRQQRNLLFPSAGRPPLPIQLESYPGLQAIEYETPIGNGFAWFFPPLDAASPKPTVIIAHGNGDLSDDWLDPADEFRHRGYGVLLIEYPGYGHAPGTPGKEAIISTALSGYDWLAAQPTIDPNKIYLLGHSIGSGAVNAIAAERPTQGMILLSPFASVRRLARERYLPPFLVKDDFNNIDVVRDYPQPILLMHGTADTLIPYTHSESLHAAAPESDLIPLPCGHGGCIPDWSSFWDRVEAFIEEIEAS
ncbi:MAG: alpha/beta hydrolase [Chloroflexota bacterium]